MAQYIPWVISFCMLLVSVLTFSRSGTREKKEAVVEDITRFDGIKETLLKLELTVNQINSTTSETRSDIKAMNNKINELDKEQGVIRRDLDTAFIRLDEIRDRVEKLEG